MSWFSKIRKRYHDMLLNRAELVNINRRNVELIYPHNARKHYPIADDKLLTKEILQAAGVPVPETLATCSGLHQVREVMSFLVNQENFVVKPASSSGGQGILVIQDLNPEGAFRKPDGSLVTLPMMQKHLADIVFGTYSNRLEDRAFVERRIEPHSIYKDFWPKGLCDIRVITLRSLPVLSMVRVPTAQSGGRANLHQGGLGLALDLKTGVTVRAWHRGASIQKHPETGMNLLGIQLPDWPATLELARRAAEAVPLGYLGIDVVVAQDLGPLVLEINVRPGLEIQNVNALGLALAIEREQT